MLFLGSLAILFPLVASLWVTTIVALVFLVAGLVSWLTTLARARQLKAAHAFWRLVVATLFAAAGFWMVSRLASDRVAAASPVAALALAIGAVFVIEGTVATLVALSNRPIQGWGWGLTNGLLTLCIGLLILSLKALHLLWVLGTLVGISFLLSGLDLLRFSAEFHSPEEGLFKKGEE